MFGFATLVLAGVVHAGSIKSWSSGEALTAADLNANFAHLHANLGHGHGAAIVNSDISGTAAISHSKMATPALLPKAWGSVTSSCGSTPCTVAAQSGVTSATRSGAGVYEVTLSGTRTGSYNVIVNSGVASRLCVPSNRLATTFAILCYSDFPGTVAADSTFDFVVLDDNN